VQLQLQTEHEDIIRLKKIVRTARRGGAKRQRNRAHAAASNGD
jgi:hypothetical protein